MSSLAAAAAAVVAGGKVRAGAILPAMRMACTCRKLDGAVEGQVVHTLHVNIPI